MTTRRLLSALCAGLPLAGCDARVDEPRALWALWLLPLLAVFLAWCARRRVARLRRFASAPMIERLGGAPSALRTAVKAALVVVAAAAMLLALARFRIGYSWEEVERRGVDIVVALDVSDSMLVADAGGSLPRLERARRELIDLLRRLEGDRIGIVAFAGTAFVQCPLTLDYGAAELFLQALDADAIPVEGTDLAQALETALGAFRGGAAGSRAILLITDGEDHSGRAAQVASKLGEEGVRVFAIGIGSADGAPIPASGGGFRRDRDGHIILSRLDERTLQQIALSTGGRYVRSVSGDLDLEEVYDSGIQATLEEREIEARLRQRFHDRFQWLLGAALAALMLESLLAERGGRRPRGIGAKRRAGGPASSGTRSAPSARANPERRAHAAPAAAMLLAAAAAIGALPAEGQETQPEAAARSRGEGPESGEEAGARAPAVATAADAGPEREPPARRHRTPEAAYEAGDFEQALDGFLDLQVERPDDPAVTMNVGAAHYRLGDLEAAASSFEAAGAAAGGELRAEAWYDLANVAQRQGRLEEAIELYHRSLDLDPGDEDAKWNLEMARIELERQREQEQERQRDSRPDPKQEQQGGQQQGGDGEQPSGREEERSGQSGAAEEEQPSREEAAGGRAEEPGREEENGQRPTGGQPGARSGEPAPGELSAAEIERLLDSIEEGRPRRKVPPGRRRSQEKDW